MDGAIRFSLCLHDVKGQVLDFYVIVSHKTADPGGRAV
jgi:hypothetical protein